jgi:hypothetical protein
MIIVKYPETDKLATSLPPLTFTLEESLGIRVYLDSRPHCMETSPLHKGLVLMANNEELIQEGIGFGVPVVKYKDKTYFSGSSQSTVVQSSPVIIKRRFVLDCISKKKIAKEYINDSFYHILHRKFSSFYLMYPQLSALFNFFMELRNLLGIQTELNRVSPRGAVTVIYRLMPSEIKVTVDFTRIASKDAKELLVLNEQGSIFDRYVDSSGLFLASTGISGWAKVLADEASLYCSCRNAKFTIKKSHPAQLFRGWEATKHRFSWSGLSYSLPIKTRIFNYSILFENKKPAIENSASFLAK